MNQLSLQVVTWGMVSSAVTAAVLLAMAGDAASDSRRDRTTPAFMQAATSRPAAQPTHPALYARKAQRPGADVAPVSLYMPRPSRGRDDS